MTSWTFAKVVPYRLKVIQGKGYNYKDIFLCKVWFPRNDKYVTFRLLVARNIGTYVTFFDPKRWGFGWFGWVSMDVALFKE